MNQDVDIAILYHVKTMNNKNHEYYMKEALKQARLAYNKGEVPVGCVIVYNDKIIARAHNLRKTKNDVFAHAESIAIKKANKKLDSWMLDDVVLYVTLEPCLMCSEVILQSRIKTVVYGAREPKFGAVDSLMQVFETKGLNHKVSVVSGVLEEESSNLLKNFFKELRNNKTLQKNKNSV